VSNLHELLQAIASSFHDVRTYRSDVIAPVLYVVEWRVRNKVRLEPVTYPAAQDKVPKLPAAPAFGARDEMILGGHHESIGHSQLLGQRHNRHSAPDPARRAVEIST
jgi:hypothetical protein